MTISRVLGPLVCGHRTRFTNPEPSGLRLRVRLGIGSRTGGSSVGIFASEPARRAFVTRLSGAGGSTSFLREARSLLYPVRRIFPPLEVIPYEQREQEK